MTAARVRCGWATSDPLYIAYHDDEWGVPQHDEQRLFEMLVLEGAQAGLSWITILRKREGYRRAFDFWYRESAVLEPAVREVRYETLVMDFEVQVRAIAEFLQLPWDERMLSPAAHAQAKGFISTPSYSQVVQPVNRLSVGRWHPYRAHFAAVLPRLAPYLARWNYED